MKKEPLYFYHVVDKNADLSSGLLSLKYMYDHKMFELFDKNVEKYKDRIVNFWNIPKYKGKKELTREEYLDGLKTFRGAYGDRYIYFFRFPPKKELGPRMEELLKHKAIVRIDTNDERVQEKIDDIFYGFDMSHSDNKLLDRTYYENITEEEYFSKYDDTLQMNFATLNHIGIAFRDGYCPKEFLERIH